MGKMTFYLPMVFLLGIVTARGVDSGTVVQTQTKLGPVIKTTFAWTSGTTNDSVSATGDTYVRGELLRSVFIPSATAAPTGAYTATLKDTSGVDLLAGRGSGLSTSVTTTVKSGVLFTDGTSTNVAAFAVNDLLTVAVTNCGNSKSGQIIIYTR